MICASRSSGFCATPSRSCCTAATRARSHEQPAISPSSRGPSTRARARAPRFATTSSLCSTNSRTNQSRGTTRKTRLASAETSRAASSSRRTGRREATSAEDRTWLNAGIEADQIAVSSARIGPAHSRAVWQARRAFEKARASSSNSCTVQAAPTYVHRPPSRAVPLRQPLARERLHPAAGRSRLSSADSMGPALRRSPKRYPVPRPRRA